MCAPELASEKRRLPLISHMVELIKRSATPARVNWATKEMRKNPTMVAIFVLGIVCTGSVQLCVCVCVFARICTRSWCNIRWMCSTCLYLGNICALTTKRQQGIVTSTRRYRSKKNTDNVWFGAATSIDYHNLMKFHVSLHLFLFQIFFVSFFLTEFRFSVVFFFSFGVRKKKQFSNVFYFGEFRVFTEEMERRAFVKLSEPLKWICMRLEACNIVTQMCITFICKRIISISHCQYINFSKKGGERTKEKRTAKQELGLWDRKRNLPHHRRWDSLCLVLLNEQPRKKKKKMLKTNNNSTNIHDSSENNTAAGSRYMRLCI